MNCLKVAIACLLFAAPSTLFAEGFGVIDDPAEALTDVFEPNLTERSTCVMADPETDAIYLVGWNSDGAGGYVIAFRFEDGKYAGRIALSPF